MRANWIPHLENQEADDLTNLEFKSFEARHRIDVDLDRLEFGVRNELLEVGDAYVQEIDDLKKQAKAEGAVKAAKRKRLPLTQAEWFPYRAGGDKLPPP